MDSQAPTSRKGVQQLTGRLATLELLISHFTGRLNPFFITLKGAERAGWNEECDQDFMVTKQYLTEPPILASPEACNTLYHYLVVSEVLISATLFNEKQN